MQPEQTVDIDRLPAETGSTVEFSEVLLVAGDGGDVQLGAPFVDGARVIAEVVDQTRGKKLLVFKYKNKTRYRRRQGHRQAFTRLAIKQILTDGQPVEPSTKDKPPTTRRRRAAPRTEQAEATAIAEPPAAEAPPAPRRASRPRRAAGQADTQAATAGEPGPARRARVKKTSLNEEVKEDGS